MEALLHDDGLGEVGEGGQVSRLSDSVSTTNVMEALQQKYSLLQDKVVMEMATFAASMSDILYFCKSDVCLSLKSVIQHMKGSD